VSTKYKAVKHSSLVEPVRILVGPKSFVVHMRQITPAHDEELRAEARRSGRWDGEVYSELYFNAFFKGVEGLTPEIAETMVLMENGASPQPPVDEAGTISEAEFLRFLWETAHVDDFQAQILNAQRRFLQLAQTHKEQREKN
jgi:hypothetical protein